MFFVANLVVFYGLGVLGVREGIAFFLWVGIFNVLIIAQFWGFANDLYSESQGRRLFPAIALGIALILGMTLLSRGALAVTMRGVGGEPTYLVLAFFAYAHAI